MKSRTIAIAVAAVATGGWLTGAVATAALFTSPVPQASDSLKLSPQQQQTAWNDLSTGVTSTAPADFKATTSSAIPSTLEVRAVPGKTARDVPALQPYDYARTPGALLIVNPHDMMIAEVITG
ncbi:MAG: hypothetical protein ABSE22_15580 [Xanthobacteraceae bacterium]|jgi:hypothetical protein